MAKDSPWRLAQREGKSRPLRAHETWRISRRGGAHVALEDPTWRPPHIWLRSPQCYRIRLTAQSLTGAKWCISRMIGPSRMLERLHRRITAIRLATLEFEASSALTPGFGRYRAARPLPPSIRNSPQSDSRLHDCFPNGNSIASDEKHRDAGTSRRTADDFRTFRRRGVPRDALR